MTVPTGSAASDEHGFVLTVRDDDTLAEAARRMQCHHVGSLIVVNGSGNVVGIITERDIIGGCTASALHPKEVRVAEVMTRDVVSARPGTPVNAADELMATHGIRHLPVVEDGKAVGMISARDVLAARLGIVQALKDAAEQIALLSKNVRRLDLQELLERISTEVPKVFGAGRWALYLAGDERGNDEGALTQRMDCPRDGEALADRARQAASADGSGLIAASVPPACERLGADGCCVLVPLNSPGPAGECEDQRPAESSCLCMCGLPEVTESSAEVLRYKLALIADILTVNLANAKLYQAAYRDPLTGLQTRRALEEALAVEHSRSTRHGRPFCVAMMDVDRFKGINDAHGHAVGDDILKRLGAIVGAAVRAHDLPARHGGDEVAVLIPETRVDAALKLIDRLRQQVAAELRTPDEQPVTVSCGVAEWSGLAEDTGPDVVRRADAALYEAKRAGRNRVVAASAAPVPYGVA